MAKKDREKTINKKEYKQAAGKCRLCGNPEYDVRHVHRIVEGAEGGKYTYNNVVALCANCHSLVHKQKKIVIDRYYPSTAGYLLRIVEDGIEKFV